MTPPNDRKQWSNVLGTGLIAALLIAVSVLMGLVSVALYRIEREEIDEGSNTGFVSDSG